MKKNSNSHNIHAKQATIYTGGKEIRILEEWEKQCELTKGSKNAFERIEGGKIVKVRNKNKA